MDAWKPTNPTVRNMELIGQGIVVTAMFIVLLFALFILA